MLDRHRLQELADMVDDQPAGQPLQQCFTFSQQAAVQLQLDAPAEARDAGRDRFQSVPRQRTARQHLETRAANAGVGQALQLGIADVGPDDCDTARLVETEGCDRLDGTAVVEAVGRWLHDHRTVQAQGALHGADVGRDVGPGRAGAHRGRGHGLGRIIDVNVAVAGLGRRDQPCGWAAGMAFLLTERD
jgi:hypothetical protein